MKKSVLACLLALALLATMLTGCAVTKKDPSESSDTTSVSDTATDTTGDIPGMSPELAELAESLASFEGLESLLGKLAGPAGLPKLDVAAFQGGITADVSVDGVGAAKLYASEGYFGFAVPGMFEGTAVITPEELASILETYDFNSLLGGALGGSGLPVTGETDPQALMAQVDALIRVFGEQAVYCLAFLPENCVQVIHKEETSVELKVSITAADVAAMLNGYGAYLLENGKVAALAAALAPFIAEYTEERLSGEISAFAERAKTVTAEDLALPDISFCAGYRKDGANAWLELTVGEEFSLGVELNDTTYSSEESEYSEIRSIDVVVDYGGAEYALYAGIYSPFYNAGTKGARIYATFSVDGAAVFELDAGASVTSGEKMVIRPYLVLVAESGVIGGANICVEGEITVAKHPGDLTYVTGEFESGELNAFYENENYTGVQVIPLNAAFELVYDPAGTVTSTFPDQATWIPMSGMFGY